MVYALDISGSFAPAKFANLASFINIILPLMMIGASLVFLAMILYGGLSWVMAGGNPENVAKAQKIFVNAIIGLVIVVFGFVITKIIGFVLNVQILPQ